jgi:hypothetical protein
VEVHLKRQRKMGERFGNCHIISQAMVNQRKIAAEESSRAAKAALINPNVLTNFIY